MVVLLIISLFALLYNISCSDIKKDWGLFMTVSNIFVDNKFDGHLSDGIQLNKKY